MTIYDDAGPPLLKGEGDDDPALTVAAHEAALQRAKDELLGHDDLEEIRVKNDATGGEKGQKIERFDLIPWDQLRKVARVFGIGSKKYQDRNWERGYDWGLSAGSLGRHFALWMSGESEDPDGFHHLAAVCFHALALMRFEETHPELDDRQTRPEEDEEEVIDRAELAERLAATLTKAWRGAWEREFFAAMAQRARNDRR